MALVGPHLLTDHMDFVDEDHLRWSVLRISGLHSRSAWLSGDAAMRSTQQPWAQIKTQFVELHLEVLFEVQSLNPLKGRFESECSTIIHRYTMLIHFDIVCLDLQHSPHDLTSKDFSWGQQHGDVPWRAILECLRVRKRHRLCCEKFPTLKT